MKFGRTKACCFAGMMVVLQGSAQERYIELPSALGETELIDFEGPQIHADWSFDKSSAQLSSRRYKMGKQSLEWNWQGGASVVLNRKINYLPQWNKKIVRTNLGDKTETSSPTAFTMWVYNEVPVEDKLTIEFGRGDQMDCSFDFYLDFTGWRNSMIHFDRGAMRGTPHVDMDLLRIKAPREGSGRLYLDGMITSAEMNPMTINPSHQVRSIKYHARRPSKHWQRLYEWSKLRPFTPAAESVLQEESKAIRLMNERYVELIAPTRNDALSEKAYESIKAEFVALELFRGEDGVVTGPPVFLRYYNELHQRVPENQQTKFYLLRDFTTLLKKVAVASSQAEGQQRTELAAMVITMLDHLHEQGFAEGGMLGWIHHYGYHARNLIQAAYLVKEDLAEEGKLERVIRDLRYFYGIHEIYDDSGAYGERGVKGGDSDALNTVWFARLGVLLLTPDSPEKVRDLRCFTHFFDTIAMGAAPGLADAFKADGSTFHHSGFVTMGYGVGSLTGAARVCHILNHTLFAPTGEGYETFKRCLAVHREYLNHTYIGQNVAQVRLNLSGACHPEHIYELLAAQDDVDGNRCYDKDVAELYLAVTDAYGQETELSRELRTAGFKSAPRELHRTLSYAALALHRYKDALLTVKGHSRYAFPFECWGVHYATMTGVKGFGHLELTYPEIEGEKRANNTFDEAGWDWNKYPGTTTVDMPWDTMETIPYKVGDEGAAQLFSDQAFCGGLNLDKNGIFAGIFHGHDEMLLESFYANKSWFFMDDLVVCVGSGIKDVIREYPTVTTVLQQTMASTNEPLIMNGKVETAFPFENSSIVGNSSTWLLDNRKTGYILSPGTNLKVSRCTQKTPNKNNTEMLSGDYVKAWIDHGSAPEHAGYEYAVVVKTTAEQMKQLAQHPTYRVLCRDAQKHIVSFPGQHAVGYTFFNRQNSVEQGPVKAVDTPCILMTQLNGRTMTVSAVDPDLHIYDGASDDTLFDGSRKMIGNYSKVWYYRESTPSRVRVIIEGPWKLTSPHDKVKASPYDNDTLIEFTTKDGLCVDFELEPRT